jgi:hypothetical protein
VRGVVGRRVQLRGAPDVKLLAGNAQDALDRLCERHGVPLRQRSVRMDVLWRLVRRWARRNGHAYNAAGVQGVAPT